MKEEQTTYSKDDMLKLINTAATNLVMKKKKVSLEGHIRKLMEERNYTLEIVTSARRKVEELDPELRKAEESARESSELFTLLNAQREALENELERLRTIGKKASLLQQKTAEVTTLREGVAAIQGQYERKQQAYAEKKRYKEDLENKKESAITGMQGFKEQLASLPAVREQITARISGFDLAGYLDTLSREASDLGKHLPPDWASAGAKPDSLPLKDELTLLVNSLESYTKVENLHRIVNEADPEDQNVLTGFNKIRDTDQLNGIRQGIKKELTGLAEYARKELHRFEEQKRVFETKIGAIENTSKRLKTDLLTVEEGLKTEREFRDRSKERLKGLENELAAQKTEVEQMKNRAETVLSTIEANKLFVKSLEPSKEYIKNINRRLTGSLEEYKRAFESLAWVVKEYKK